MPDASTGVKPAPPGFLVHGHVDNIAVAVTAGIAAPMSVTLWLMDCDETITMTAVDADQIGITSCFGETSEPTGPEAIRAEALKHREYPPPRFHPIA
jgi:hypothetical protein